MERMEEDIWEQKEKEEQKDSDDNKMRMKRMEGDIKKEYNDNMEEKSRHYMHVRGRRVGRMKTNMRAK